MSWKSLSQAHRVSSDASTSPASLEVARRLLARERAGGSEGEPVDAGVALQRTLARVAQALRDSMGEDGCNALLARALARTDSVHPALQSIRVEEDSIYLDGVVASVEAHGVGAVTTAIEALLAALVDVLARLIGEDMAIRLIENDASRPRTGGGAQSP